MPEQFDIIVIGGGIAGAAAAYHLAARHHVLVLERELFFGAHATGRSAAILLPDYGSAAIRALTAESLAFLQSPPPGFADAPLLKPRGLLTIAQPHQHGALAQVLADTHRRLPSARIEDGAFAANRAPILRAQAIAGAIYDPQAWDIDVDLLLQSFIASARRQGATIRPGMAVTGIARTGDRWSVMTGDETFSAPILVNAAGAWADAIHRLAGGAGKGLSPLLRSAALVRAPAELLPADMPFVMDVEERFYCKPDAGLLLISPADESPVEPHDALSDDLAIAEGLDRAQHVLSFAIRRVERSWAGLRTFAADRQPVLGFDDRLPGFFWSAGQGGYGVQTAPAWGNAVAGSIDSGIC